MTLYYDNLQTPLGAMQVCATDKAIKSIHFVERTEKAHPNPITQRACKQLSEYFAGQRSEFDLPLQADGTPFQQRVWQALNDISFGETCSYQDIARAIGNPKAVRAVGAANGRNPMTIVVPCHRVVGSNGKLTGYASGVDRKAWLLNHESPSLF